MAKSATRPKTTLKQTPPKVPLLEELIFLILAEGEPKSRPKGAAKAMDRLRQDFVDWNEARVSAPGEIADTLAREDHPLRDIPAKAALLRKVLELIFSENNDMSLDFLQGAAKTALKAFFAEAPGLSKQASAAIIARLRAAPARTAAKTSRPKPRKSRRK